MHSPEYYSEEQTTNAQNNTGESQKRGVQSIPSPHTHIYTQKYSVYNSIYVNPLKQENITYDGRSQEEVISGQRQGTRKGQLGIFSGDEMFCFVSGGDDQVCSVELND